MLPKCSNFFWKRSQCNWVYLAKLLILCLNLKIVWFKDVEEPSEHVLIGFDRLIFWNAPIVRRVSKFRIEVMCSGRAAISFLGKKMLPKIGINLWGRTANRNTLEWTEWLKGRRRGNISHYHETLGYGYMGMRVQSSRSVSCCVVLVGPGPSRSMASAYQPMATGHHFSGTDS